MTISNPEPQFPQMDVGQSDSVLAKQHKHTDDFLLKVDAFHRNGRDIARESYQRYSNCDKPHCAFRRDTGITLTNAKIMLRCGALLNVDGYEELFNQVDASLDQIDYIARGFNQVLLPDPHYDIHKAFRTFIENATEHAHSLIHLFKSFIANYEKKSSPPLPDKKLKETSTTAAEAGEGITATNAELTDISNESTEEKKNNASDPGISSPSLQLINKKDKAIAPTNDAIELPRHAPQLLITSNEDDTCDLVIRGMSKQAANNISTKLKTVMQRTRRIKGTKNSAQKQYLALHRALDMAALLQVDKQVPVYFVVDTRYRKDFEEKGYLDSALTLQDLSQLAENFGLSTHITVATVDEDENITYLSHIPQKRKM